jgi:23S rRNA (uracil1939-C5)-methyltransferase
LLTGEGSIQDKIGPFRFQVSANSFFQTNTATAEKLYSKMVEYAELEGNERVLDLYSGTGTIPILLANRVREVTGMEISQSAVLDAQSNCSRNQINNCHFVWGDIREKLGEVKYTPEVLILDPPRAGMHKHVLAQVLALASERVIYISCNPTTMARDLAQMIDQYELMEVQPVDMFPHTYHVECVAKLWRRRTCTSH